MLLRGHRQDRAHAGPQRGGDKIGGREGFPFTLVIRRRVGRNLRVGRTMDRVAMQVTGVFDADIDHGSI